ncbi:MAG: 2-oxo acid dehydrogenase subunit E2 [Prolixibacteraceae bacterium]|jgi:2-oxoglutarate dehydrogenase E2 component (dihydrolipoamide succinyltransferase)|nr:2-oxo acid dehydrogenase subunit E2 [Prolixibacteraceae bacterium]
MSEFEVLIPKLGESIQEATITKIFVKVGDSVHEDDLLFEVATDKVDSEIPSPVSGTIKSINCKVDDLLAVGKIAMIIDLEGNSEKQSDHVVPEVTVSTPEVPIPTSKLPDIPREKLVTNRFYSPLVKNMAKKEGIPLEELEGVEGSGLGGRIQKNDLIKYIEGRENKTIDATSRLNSSPSEVNTENSGVTQRPQVSVSIGAEDTILEMDRVRKLIARHMVMSKQTAPHVTSFVEADATEMVLWRNRYKDEFQAKYGEKLTFLPFFTEAVAKAITEFPMINSSVDGEQIILRKRINVGIAVATNSGNLMVPVIKDADTKNLLGLTKDINQFAEAGRNEKLQPDSLQGGTFTITNFGSFGNTMGTPIINQPQVAILAIGTIEKKPAVIETAMGDAIVVRHKVFLSLSYDHRVVDGMLGGKFLRRIADLIEGFNSKRTV